MVKQICRFGFLYNNKGRIRSIVSGPMFAETDTAELQTLVDKRLLKRGGAKLDVQSL